MQPSIENRLRALESRRRALRYLPPLILRPDDDEDEARRAFVQEHGAPPMLVLRFLRAGESAS